MGYYELNFVVLIWFILGGLAGFRHLQENLNPVFNKPGIFDTIFILIMSVLLVSLGPFGYLFILMLK